MSDTSPNTKLFLLSFFDQKEDHYESKEVNGFVLVKQKDNAANPPVWRIAVYTPESYQKSQSVFASKISKQIPLALEPGSTLAKKSKRWGKHIEPPVDLSWIK